MYRNRYTPELVSRTIKSHLNGLKRDKEVGTEKCVITLKIPYINKRSAYLKKNIKQLIISTFSAAKRRVVFISSPMLAPEGKENIPTFNISMVIYQYKCYCDNSYIGLTSRQLKKRVTEHIPALL